MIFSTNFEKSFKVQYLNTKHGCMLTEAHNSMDAYLRRLIIQPTNILGRSFPTGLIIFCILLEPLAQLMGILGATDAEQFDFYCRVPIPFFFFIYIYIYH